MNGKVSYRMFVYVSEQGSKDGNITGGSKSDLMRWMADMRKSNGLETFFPT